MGSLPRTVLLVDDFAGVLRALRPAFEAAGFTVCAEATNGIQAIKAAAEHKPGLIVLDHAMPIMSGLAAVPELRRILPDTPIILFTIHWESIPLIAARAAGITSVIAKPDLNALIREVQSHFQARKSANGFSD